MHKLKSSSDMDYLKRIADEELSLRLEAFGAVQINGPKWCGKTTTAERQAKSVVKLQDPDKRAGYLATIRTKPSILLKGETPRLIDEWQDAPILWDAVRTTVDQRKLKRSVYSYRFYRYKEKERKGYTRRGKKNAYRNR